MSPLVETGVLKWTSLNRSPVLATRCRYWEGAAEWGAMSEGGSLYSKVQCSLVDKITDRQDWRHYLPATSLACGVMLISRALPVSQAEKRTPEERLLQHWKIYVHINPSQTETHWWQICRFELFMKTFTRSLNRITVCDLVGAQATRNLLWHPDLWSWVPGWLPEKILNHRLESEVFGPWKMY